MGRMLLTVASRSMKTTSPRWPNACGTTTDDRPARRRFRSGVAAEYRSAVCRGLLQRHGRAASRQHGAGARTEPPGRGADADVPCDRQRAALHRRRYRLCGRRSRYWIDDRGHARPGATRAPRARAIFPVHLNGAAVSMPAVAAAARARGLAVVEDACHALATTYSVEGRTGTVGDCRYSDMAAFSFHPVKAIAMGEGGAVTTNNRALDERLRLMRNHGMTKATARFLNRDLAFDRGGEANPWYYEMPEPGLNYRVPDVLCALGISQLKKLPRFVARRRELAALYDEALADFAPIIRPVPRSSECQSAFHIYVVLVDFERVGRSRAEVMNTLRADA